MQEFNVKFNIYYEDTDCGGVVYHANYIKYAERVRSDFLRFKGVNQRQLAKNNCLFTVASLSIKYIKPAFLDDKIVVTSKIKSIRNVTILFEQNIYKINANTEKDLLAILDVKVGSISNEGKPVAIPKEVIKNILK